LSRFRDDFLTLWKDADADNPILVNGQGRIRGAALADFDVA
jgi:hypothetical protein